MQMKALAKAKDWEGLEAFAREKKSPIGLDPFIATAKKAGSPEGTLSRSWTNQVFWVPCFGS